jgi:tyrosyl-tRNA synthetase
MQHDLKDLFSRGVSKFIDPGERFKKKLEAEPEKVVIKFGVDPTRPDLHLGHAVCLRKLRKFQELGCKVVFLVGDFTASIGDPTGKSKVRPELDQKEAEANVQTYLAQVGKILMVNDPKRFAWIRNSDWFVGVNDVQAAKNVAYEIQQDNQNMRIEFPAGSTPAKAAIWEKTRMQVQMGCHQIKSFSLINVLSVLRQITHGQLIERDMFQERLKAGDPLFMHEMLYPILQGIDSSTLFDIFGACDLELGGTDQHFNMLMGRTVLEMNKKTPQAVMTLDILEGTDGKEKMSKSLDNYIGISEPPTEIFGKTMRIPDELIPRWVELTTDLNAADFVQRLKKENPKTLKVELAKSIISQYYDAAAAAAAAEEFDRVHAGGSSGQPDEIPEIKIEEGNWNVIELLVQAKLVASKSDARRLIEGGGVKANGEKVESIDAGFEVGKTELVLQVGKRKWARISS